MLIYIMTLMAFDHDKIDVTSKFGFHCLISPLDGYSLFEFLTF